MRWQNVFLKLFDIVFLATKMSHHLFHPKQESTCQKEWLCNLQKALFSWDKPHEKPILLLRFQGQFLAKFLKQKSKTNLPRIPTRNRLDFWGFSPYLMPIFICWKLLAFFIYLGTQPSFISFTSFPRKTNLMSKNIQNF